MKNSKNIYTDLAALARRGDRTAELELHDRLGCDMVFVVRRILSPGGVITSRDREVYAEAARMGLADVEAPPARRDNLVERLARRLRDRLFNDLVPPRDRDRPLPATVRVGADISLQMVS